MRIVVLQQSMGQRDVCQVMYLDHCILKTLIIGHTKIIMINIYLMNLINHVITIHGPHFIQYMMSDTHHQQPMQHLFNISHMSNYIN